MDPSENSPRASLSPIARRYLRAVKRELCLRGADRKQALKALKESFRGIRCSYGDFITRFGSPLQTADMLNHSIEGYVFDKSDLRIPCMALGIAGALVAAYRIAYGAFLRFLASSAAAIEIMTDSASIGVIGGADGPTSIFITTAAASHSQLITMLGLLLAAAGFTGFYLLRYRKHKLP